MSTVLGLIVVQPGKIYEGIALVLNIMNSCRLLFRIIWHLVVIAANRSHEPELVIRRLVEDQRTVSAESCGLVVQHVSPSESPSPDRCDIPTSFRSHAKRSV